MGRFNWRRVNASRRVKALLMMVFLLVSFCLPLIVFSLVSSDNMRSSDDDDDDDDRRVGQGVATSAVSYDQAMREREDKNDQKVKLSERVNGALKVSSADASCGASFTDVPLVVVPLYSRRGSGGDHILRGEISLPFLSLYRDHLLGMATRFEQGMATRQKEEEERGSGESNEHDTEHDVTVQEFNDVEGIKSGGRKKSVLSNKFGMVPISPLPFQDNAEEQHPLRHTLSDSYVDIPSQLVMSEDPVFPHELPFSSIAAAAAKNAYRSSSSSSSSTSTNQFIGSVSRPISLYSLAAPPDDGRRGPRGREPHAQQRNKISLTKNEEGDAAMMMSMNKTGVVVPEKEEEEEEEEGIFVVEDDDGSLVEVEAFVAKETLSKADTGNQQQKKLTNDGDGLYANSNEKRWKQRRSAHESLSPSLVTRNEILLGRKVEYLYRSQRLPPESAPWYADQFPNSIWGELWRTYRNAKLDAIIDPQSRAPCLISLLSTGNCDFYFESMEECVGRHAAATASTAAADGSSFGLGDVLARHCLESDVWKNNLSESSTTLFVQPPLRAHDKYYGIPVKLSPVHEAELCDVGGMALLNSPITTLSTPARAGVKLLPLYRRPFIAVVNGRPLSSASFLGLDTAAYLRPFMSNTYKGLPDGENSSFNPSSLSPTLKEASEGHGKAEGVVPYISPMGGPRVCRRNNALQYPIAFGVPRRNVARRLLPKLFDFSPIPVHTNDRKRALTFNDEDLMTAITSMSFYCLTAAKGGWDCGRHHEIMAVGCVPYFADVFAAPPHILSHFPMRLLRQVVQHPALGHIGYVSGAMKDSLKSIVFSSSSSSRNSVKRRRVAAFHGRRRGGDENDEQSQASFPSKSVFRIKSRSSANEEEMPRERLIFHEDFKDPANLLQLRFPPIGQMNSTTDASGGGSTSSSSKHPLRLVHDKEDYWPLARRLLKFSQRFITAEAMVSYMLFVMGLMGPSSMLLSSTSLRKSENDPPNALVSYHGEQNNERRKGRNPSDSDTAGNVNINHHNADDKAPHHHSTPFRKTPAAVRKMLFFSRGANVWDNIGSTIITGANGLGIEITVVAHGWKGKGVSEGEGTEENGGVQPPKRDGERGNANSGEELHAEQQVSASAYHCISPAPISALHHQAVRQKSPQPTIPWQQMSKRTFLIPTSSGARQQQSTGNCGKNATTRVEVEVDPLLSFFRYGPIPSRLLVSSSSSFLSSTSHTNDRNGPSSSSSSTSSSTYLSNMRSAAGRASLHGGGIPWSNRVRGGAQMLRFVSSVEELVAENKKKRRRTIIQKGGEERRQNHDETTTIASRPNREQERSGGIDRQIHGRRWSRQRMMRRNIEEEGKEPRPSLAEEKNGDHGYSAVSRERLEPVHRVGLRVFDSHISLAGGASAADEAGNEDATQQQQFESGSFMNSKSFSEAELGNTLIEYDLIVFGFTRFGGGLNSPPHEEIRYINRVYNKAAHERRRMTMGKTQRMGADRNRGVVGEEKQFVVPPLRHKEYSTASRVAVIDHADSAIEEPEIGSDTLAREVFYFSRELRRQTC